ncbi:thioredoxin domain-containing protein [Olivibacter sp. CPCC 100613]|uniref:thioredoxin domain-containing protein n=1 Tax=Olivibacter sp. CPCC 100613 TaxID=3079931 RepID=UPI002FF71E21
MKQLILSMLLLIVGHAVLGQEKTDSHYLAFEQKLMDAGPQAQILDARSEEEYAQNRVPGAVNIPTEAMVDKVGAHLDKRKPVFIYSIGNGRSAKVARHLRGIGFAEVYEFPGGLSKWIARGKPVLSTGGEGLSLAAFNEQISADKLVLVEVGSRYCGGCKKLKPIVASLVAQNQSLVKLVDIEAYENKKLIQELAVDALPTLILYKGNKVIWRKQGLSSKDEINEELRKHKI